MLYTYFDHWCLVKKKYTFDDSSILFNFIKKGRSFISIYNLPKGTCNSLIKDSLTHVRKNMKTERQRS